MYVAIVLNGCRKSRSEDVAHVAYVASVSEAHCKRLFKMFHLFPYVCCKRFDLDVAYVFTHMLQQYVPKCFIVVSVFCCSKCFHVASCKCVYLRVAYVFTHMMQVFYLDVVYVYNGFECFSGMFRLCFPDACCNCVYLDVAYVLHICYMCFIWMFAYSCNGF